ncbi:MAG: 50S ribosomal protein L1 [Candidatus Thorarchaeota archaeon]
MSLSRKDIELAVAEARGRGKERGIKFEQSFDLSVNFRRKEMDVSRPENRINQELVLPNPLYPPAKVCAFGDGEFAQKAAEAGTEQVIPKEDIPKIGGEKKARRRLVKNFDFFIASTETMPLVGRYLGQALGSRGKMPKPFPPQADLSNVVASYKKTVRIKMRNTPTFHVKVGHERMSDSEIAENIESVLSFIQNRGQWDKVGSIYLKTTMGPPVRIEIRK